MKERIIEMDILRGLGILLVILGHCVPDFPVDLRSNVLAGGLEIWIYRFHMPLFFLCSGYAFCLTTIKVQGLSFSTFINQRIKRIVIPYLVFSVISMLLRIIFSSVTRSGINIGDAIGGIFFEGKYFWFLYTLFLISIIFKVLWDQTKNLSLMLGIAIVLYVVYVILPIKFLCIDRIGVYSLYYVLGCYLFKYREQGNKIIQKNIFFVGSIVLYVVLNLFNLHSGALVMESIFKVFYALIGILLFYGISLKYKDFTFVEPFILHFGKYSLQYYLLHMIISLPVYYVVAKISVSIPLISVFLNFILITLLSYIALTIAKKLPFTYIILGIK